MAAVPRPMLDCDVFAEAALAAALGAIVRTCAQDLHQPVNVRVRELRVAVPTITVLLPAESFHAPHQAWCLACRLACFCPHARVGVHVQGAAAGRAA